MKNEKEAICGPIAMSRLLGDVVECGVLLSRCSPNPATTKKILFCPILLLI